MCRYFEDHRHDLEASIRVGLSVGLPLFAIYAIDRMDLAAFGGLAMLYGHHETGRRQVGTQITAGAALVLTVAIAAVFSATHGPTWLLGCLLVATVIGAGTLGAAMQWVPRGEMFFVLVLRVIASMPVPWGKIPIAIAVAVLGAAFSVLMGAILPFGRDAEPGKVDLRRRMSDGFIALDRRQHGIAIVASAAGVLAAWLVALGLGIGHPFWGPVTVAALMPALAAVDVYRRMVHLMVGTLGGVGIAAVLFSFEPGHLALIVIIVICQIAAEFFVARSYGVALLFFSPLAVGMSNLYTGLPWMPLLQDRIAEAALGTVVALLVIVAGRRILSRYA